MQGNALTTDSTQRLSAADLNLVRVGLARNCAALPSTFYGALERFVLNSPEALLVACSSSHQVGLLGEALQTSSIMEGAPRWLIDSIDQITAANRLLFEVFETACLELEYVSKLVGLTPIRIKGLSVCRRLYDDTGSRPVRDIDILIDRDKAEALYRVALSLGFIQGRFDHLLGKIVPTSNSIDPETEYEFPRMVRAIEVQGDQDQLRKLLQFEKESKYFIGSGHPVPIYVPLEIHFDLDLPGRIPRRGSKKIVSLDQSWHHLMEDDELLYMCFKAYADIEIFQKPKGIKLIADVGRMLRKSKNKIDLDALLDRAQEHGLQVPVSWALEVLGERPGVHSPLVV